VTRAATGATAALQTGSLQRYLTLLVGVALLAGAWPFAREFMRDGGAAAAFAPPHLQGLTPAALAVTVLGMAAALGCVVWHRRRLTALLLLGLAGLAVCLAFVHFSAPDLALTQLLVEMATTVLMMLALAWLPEQASREASREASRARQLRDAGLALLAGLGIAALVWQVLAQPGDSISGFFLAKALPEGGGANAVNVIIVDFRAFDTLGEITVMGLAALIVQALLADHVPRPGQAMPLPMGAQPLLLRQAARWMLPFALLVAAHLFLRGHNLPGGGFIAGLVLALALVLQAVAHGLPWLDARTRVDFGAWIGWGLLVAAATGAASWAFGAPFLTSTYDYPWLPGVGGVPLASAAAFDLGVLLVVTGATMVLLLAIARLGREAAR
jgi:multicomponent K+:H+ antiporter subunit A